MNDAIRAQVAGRAGHRCEYCRLHEDDDVYSFHVEHIIPLKHGGHSHIENLAFACQHCNLHKGSNLTGIDPTTNAIVRLFDPRRDVWDDHFALQDGGILGQTPVGRATIRVLAINEVDRVRLRLALRFDEF
jgi:5-methylcytosine-specific restriction endonuclease McrA